MSEIVLGGKENTLTDGILKSNPCLLRLLGIQNQIVFLADDLKLRGGQNTVVQVGERKTAALDVAGHPSTEALHGKRPVHPDRSHVFDAIGNVQQRMDRERACR